MGIFLLEIVHAKVEGALFGGNIELFVLALFDGYLIILLVQEIHQVISVSQRNLGLANRNLQNDVSIFWYEHFVVVNVVASTRELIVDLPSKS